MKTLSKCSASNIHIFNLHFLYFNNEPRAISNFALNFDLTPTKSITWLESNDVLRGNSITTFTRQECNDLFLHVKYEDKELYWHEFNENGPHPGAKGPFWYGTDYGSCCFFSGQANIKEWPAGTTSKDVILFLHLSLQKKSKLI